MSRTTLNDLKGHLFETIERLKAGNDPEADPKDTIDIERALAISGAAKVIVDIAKVEVSALNILARADNPNRTQSGLKNAGLIEIE